MPARAEPPASKKRKPSIQSILIALAALALLAAFLQNNYQVFSYSFGALRSLKMPVSRKMPGADSAATSKVDTQALRARKTANRTGVAQNEVGKTETPMNVNAADSLAAVSISDIRCRLAGRSQLAVSVSIRLFFDDLEREQEILFKREDIKVVVKKLFSGMLYSEATPFALQDEIKHEVNAILDSDPIRRVELLSLKPAG